MNEEQHSDSTLTLKHMRKSEKFVSESEKTSGSFILKSDNKAYEPYAVPLSDILEIWEFTCSIRTEEYDEGELKVESIMRMLRELQVELEPLKNSD